MSETPTVSHADVLDRAVVVVAHVRDMPESPPVDEHYETSTVLNISGNLLEVDAVGLDTAAASLLETQTHTTEMTCDALGRVVTQTTPDDSVTSYAYNEGGLLESVQVDVRGVAASPPAVFVDSIEYDVHGRRASVQHGNGTTTTYTYDPGSYRVRTTRPATPPEVVQGLRYFHDAIGNIVKVQDDAQQRVYFNNAQIEPHQLFTYNALSRLVEATGREHTSQGQPTSSELTPGSQPETSDPAALRAYTEVYDYDEVGNIEQIQHTASGGNWTRGYHYASDGNRLLASSLPGDTLGVPATYTATYDHDAHGNMTAMHHLDAIDWDHADRMQRADLGGGGDVYFQYDAAGTGCGRCGSTGRGRRARSGCTSVGSSCTASGPAVSCSLSARRCMSRTTPGASCWSRRRRRTAARPGRRRRTRLGTSTATTWGRRRWSWTMQPTWRRTRSTIHTGRQRTGRWTARWA